MVEDSDDEAVFIPRNYQVELIKIALEQNTIIYLPTGSGKTFIAVMVLKQMSSSLLKPYSAGGKISMILVNTVALVPQHAKYIKDHTVLTVGCYTGEMSLDFWSKGQWLDEFNKYQVIIMTCQILHNLINNGFIDLNRVNLLIFDECHRGVEDQPMRLIMKSFCNYREPPKVMGLTATLLNGNCKLSRVMDEVRNLEVTYHSRVATVDGLKHVVGYSTNPHEKFKFSKFYQLSETDKSAIHLLDELVDFLKMCNLTGNAAKVNIDRLIENLKPLEVEDTFRSLRNLIQDLIIHIKQLGSFGGYLAAIAHMIQIERYRKHCQDYNLFTVLNYVLTVFGCVKEFYETSMKSYTNNEKLYRFSSDKVLKLLEILEEFPKQSQEPLCAIIFTQRRFTAKILFHLLEVCDNLPDIKSNFIVGNKNNPYKDTRENMYIAKKNREVLESFVNKEINVLVSSNVLEEGVDIPKCTLVVKFDRSEDYRSYIQSKGRARHKSSIYYTVVENDTCQKFMQKYAEYQKVEAILNDYLIGKNQERSSPTQTELDHLYNEDVIQPYFVAGHNSAQINMHSAVALLCCYCQSLPCDQYTSYAPDWYMQTKLVNDKEKIRVVIILPTICPILEPIEGPFMFNKKNAKRAAALTACIKLHKCGELDNNLIPRRAEIAIEDVSYLFQHWPDKKDNTVGNKKTKRLHNRKIADNLSGSLLQSFETVLYLHAINIDLLYERNDLNYTIHDLLQSDLRFGFLTLQPLTQICQFPLFNSSGTLNVKLDVNIKQLILTNEQLNDVKHFHLMIFTDLLEILKSFLMYDTTGINSEQLLVVPIRKTLNTIDFVTLTEFKQIKNRNEKLSVTERMNLTVTDETYLHKIVSPWYRADSPSYVVTRVLPDKSPLSLFPNEDYGNFLDYYQEKYTQTILDHKQPLLLVRGISSKLNFLKPSGSAAKRKRDIRYEEMEEYLIPELLIKQDFPAALWLQARLLPSILSRVCYLFKLDELRRQIAREANFSIGNECKPLELDYHLLNYKPNDNLFNAGSETDIEPVNCDLKSIQICNKDFQSKCLESEFPWRNLDEPKDIERHLNVTVMDIEHYELFINQGTTRQDRLLKNDSPKKQLAITYPREFQEKTIRLLENTGNNSPDLSDIYRALTAAEANDIVNLERLEILGDSFLKLVSSLYVLVKFPKYNEGNSTSLKGKLVSNRNLFYLAERKHFGGVMKTGDFSPKEQYLPPCFTVPEPLLRRILNREVSVNCLFYYELSSKEAADGTLSQDTLTKIVAEEYATSKDEPNLYTTVSQFLNKQYVSDKTMADGVEAMLGMYFVEAGLRGGLKFLTWLGLFPEPDLGFILNEPIPSPFLSENAKVKDIACHVPQWQDLETRLGYTFKHRGFLLQALTHPSYSPNRLTASYERLEFLGDAILDFLITCFIYESCGYLSPGQVTDLRSALVNNNTFASLVVRCGLHKFLLMINSKLQLVIDKFADYLAAKNYEIDDEVLILLEEEDMNLAEYIDVPKVLGDIFEALAGAVYLDSGRDLNVVWSVFYKLMWKEIDLFSKNVPINVIRKLYETPNVFPLFSKAAQTPNNKTMLSLEFMSEGRKKVVHGFGSSKFMAKRAAAKIALRLLKI